MRVADDLLDRDFAADAPNQRWVADITYLRTWEGWLYLVAVQDRLGGPAADCPRRRRRPAERPDR